MEFKELVGKTMISVVNNNNEEIIFTDNENKVYTLYHSQDCCESVLVEDINGDLSDLVGNPLLQADESTSNEQAKEDTRSYDSVTWTFYRLATIKGSVVIRWVGESNGYYSESVDFSCK